MDYLPQSGFQPLAQHRDPISEWNVYIPLGEDRSKYIINCVRTGTVSLTNSNGEIVHRVKIGRLALQQLRFPQDDSDLGSIVVCVSAPYSGRLYVVDVYDQRAEYEEHLENQYELSKHSKNGIAKILVDGDGRILFSVDGEESSEIDLNASSKNNDAKLNIRVNGSLDSYTSGGVKFRTVDSIELVFWDGSQSSNKTRLIIKDGKVQLVGSTIQLVDQIVEQNGEQIEPENLQPILLGQSTVDLLDEILTQLAQESAGPYKLLGSAKYTEIKQKLDTLKSQISFIK